MRNRRVGQPLHPFFLAWVIAGAVACAAAQRYAPAVSIEQSSPLPPNRVATRSGVPVDYRLQIDNSSDYPITLRSVEIETVGLSGAYSMKRVRHSFAEVIPPRATATLNVRAWVQRLQETEGGQASGSVMLRGVARFDSPAGPLRRAFVGRAAQ